MSACEQSRAPEYASRAVLKLKIFRAYRVTRAVELNRVVSRPIVLFGCVGTRPAKRWVGFLANETQLMFPQGCSRSALGSVVSVCLLRRG